MKLLGTVTGNFIYSDDLRTLRQSRRVYDDVSIRRVSSEFNYGRVVDEKVATRKIRRRRVIKRDKLGARARF